MYFFRLSKTTISFFPLSLSRFPRLFPQKKKKTDGKDGEDHV